MISGRLHHTVICKAPSIGYSYVIRYEYRRRSLAAKCRASINHKAQGAATETMNDNILSSIASDATQSEGVEATTKLVHGLAGDLCIGELLNLNYSDATVLVHDYARNKVRGLPHGSFLVGTRIPLGAGATPPDADDEDASLVLLRIVGEQILPNARQMEEYRFQAGMRATETEQTWDHPNSVDRWTRNNLGFGGYKCRVLGTFRMRRNEAGHYELVFGGDLLNFYSGKGMKVYKPTGPLLKTIVNFQKTAAPGSLAEAGRLRIGRIRYAASEVSVDASLDNVEVNVDPRDFVSRRTFYGGMSRGGKSNALKVTARAVYELRIENAEARVGQLRKL